MAKKRLTDPSIPAIITLDLADLIHVVDVSDTTSHPSGSSKKASIQQIKNLIASFNDTFIELSDTPANYTGSSLKFVRVNSGETGLEFASIDLTFLGLSDTPSSYSGQSLKTIRVNAGETGLEFYTIDLSGYEQTANKGVANGYAPLNGSTKIDSIYLPSYVDDVLEYANLASFPVSGETGKIYTALDTNKIYRWSGSVYVEISSSTIPTWASTLFQSNITDGNNPFISAGDVIQWHNTTADFITSLTNDQATTSSFTVYLPKIAGQLAVHAFGTPLTQNYMVKGGANGILQSSTLVYDNGTNVGIGTITPSASAVVEITSTTQGLLIPRMTTTQRDAISTPATGLKIYNTTTNAFNYYNGLSWVAVASGSFTDTNFANTDLTFSANRTHNLNSFNLVFTGGNVGVGEITPTAKLQIKPSNISSEQALKVMGYTNDEVFVVENNGYTWTGYDTNNRVITWGGYSGNKFGIGVFDGGTQRINLINNGHNYIMPDSPTLGLHIGHSGSTIGSTFPIGKLTSTATISTNAFVVQGNDGKFTILGSSVSGNMFGANYGDSPNAVVHIKSSSGTAFRIDGSLTTNNFVVLDDGNIGIGTSSPLSKFHVVGNSRMQGLIQSISATGDSYFSGGQNLTIGGTTSYGFMLNVEGNTRVIGVIAQTTANTSYLANGGGQVAINDTSTYGRRFYVNGNGQSIWLNGNLEIGATQGKFHKGWVESASDPTATEFPDGTYGIHINTTTNQIHYVVNRGGSGLRKVELL